MVRPIVLKGRPLGGGNGPAVCVPLVGRTAAQLQEEARAVAPLAPDLIEWRADFFEGLADAGAVVAAATAIRAAATGVPLLFTRRSVREGGQPIAASEAQVVAAYRAMCEGALAELIDVEMESEASQLREARAMARASGALLVLSFHDFQSTPERATLLARFKQAQDAGAHVAKVAVMPRSLDDVLTLLSATREAASTCELPLVSMSMGPLGALTRVGGWAFGSAMTFAVGQGSSAPGQMPIADLRAALAVMQRAMQPGR